jgi:hypothetical protein
MTAVVDTGGLADCLIGMYEGKADEDILDIYAQIRREKFLKYVDARSIKNLNRVAKSDPWTVGETDKFFGILKELEGDPEETKRFLLVRLIKIERGDSKEVRHELTPKAEDFEHRVRLHPALPQPRSE